MRVEEAINCHLFRFEVFPRNQSFDLSAIFSQTTITLKICIKYILNITCITAIGLICLVPAVATFVWPYPHTPSVSWLLQKTASWLGRWRWFEKWSDGDEFVAVWHDLTVQFHASLGAEVSHEIVTVKAFANVTILQTLSLPTDGFGVG